MTLVFQFQRNMSGTCTELKVVGIDFSLSVVLVAGLPCRWLRQ